MEPNLLWTLALAVVVLASGCIGPDVIPRDDPSSPQDNERNDSPNDSPSDGADEPSSDLGDEPRDSGERFQNRDTGIFAFEPFDCPSPKPHNDTYAGQLFDSHFHMPPTENRPFDTREGRFLSDGEENGPPVAVLGLDVTVPEIDCLFQYEGTDGAFSFVGITSSYEEEMTGVDRRGDQVALVEQTVERFPDRFVPFIGIPDHGRGYPTAHAAELDDALNLSPGLFRGFGEVGLYASEGIEALAPDSERLREIYPVVRAHNLVVYFHLGMGHKESFERALEQNPDINFIFHGDQLIGHEYGHDLTQIEEIVSGHPNAFYTVDQLYGDVFLLRPEVSREEFLAHFEDYEPLLEQDLQTWKAIIERYPDQFMWGTDRGGLIWSLDRDVGWTLANYSRAFIARLDPDVQERFAYGNAQALMG